MTATEPGKWIRYDLDDLGLSLEVFADLSALTIHRNKDLTSLVQEVGPVRLILWAGPDQTLAAWRKRLDLRNEAEFEAETDTRVCGCSARRQVATVTQAGAVGAFVAHDGSIGHLYGEASTRVHVCVSFAHAGQNILQCWVVDKDSRADRAADESRFFVSMRCR